MGNQKKDSGIGITVRLDQEKVEALDEHVERLRSKLPTGVHVTRTDALRNLIERGLADAGRSR